MELGILSTVYAFLKGGLSLLKDGYFFFEKLHGKRDPLAILAIRKKWRTEFESHLERLEHAPTYGDAIIRDISRMDSYPELDKKEKGISPWFKVEIKGMYPRGFEVFLRIESAMYVESLQGWRWANYDEPGAVNVAIVGRIPFEVVKDVEWHGDQYYLCPHIYCEFSRKKKQPYEEIVVCSIEKGLEQDFFVEIAKWDDVQKLSSKSPKPHASK